MSFSSHKFSAIVGLKFRSILLNKNILLIPIIALGMTVGMKFLYRSMLDGKDLPPELLGLVLTFGLIMNIAMMGIMSTGTILAEEKEKHTLRTLMTSSVSSMEFFLGSIIPPLAIVIAINAILLPLSGFQISGGEMALYFLVTTLASITSCILGMLIGLFAKDQMSANTLVTPFALVLMLVPTFSSMVPAIEKVSKFLYTGIVAKMIATFAEGKTFSLNLLSISVLVGQILIVIILFVVFYKRNGFEQD